MHDARMGGEVLQTAGHTVVEARAHTDQQVRMVDAHVGSVGAMHAHHAQPQVAVGGEGAQAHERGGHGDVQFVGQLAEHLGGIGHDDAAARQDDGLAGLGQLFGRTAQLVQVGLVGGIVTAHEDIFRPDEFRTGLHDILGQVHEDRPGATGARKIEGLADGLGQVAHVLHQKIVFGTGTGDAHDIDFLEGVVTDELRGDLSREDDQRNGITVGCGYARNGIGGAGSGSDQTAPNLAGGTGIAISRVHSPLFMPHQNMLQFRMPRQLVININHSTARVTEQYINTFFFKGFKENLRTCEFHRVNSCASSYAPARWLSKSSMSLVLPSSFCFLSCFRVCSSVGVRKDLASSFSTCLL